MQPLYFGKEDRQLYGVFHPCLGSSGRGEGIVICNSFGQEYMRSHRAIRQLSQQLAASGYHVLRFDYLGTGDSALDLEEVTPEDWVDDVQRAVCELKALASIEVVSLLGLRLGGLVAGCAAHGLNLKHLVLWDAVPSGDVYLSELKKELLNTLYSSTNFIDAQGVFHFNGFALSARFVESLKKLSLIGHQPVTSGEKSLFVSQGGEGYRVSSSQVDELKGYEIYGVESPGDWSFSSGDGSIMIPYPMIAAIKQWFENAG